MQKFNFNNLKNLYAWDSKELDLVLDLIRPYFSKQVNVGDETTKVQPLDKVWLAGGALRRTISGEPILGHSDFDFFFGDNMNLVSFKKFVLDELKFEEVNQNQFNTLYIKDKIKFQLIHINFYDSLEEVLNSFDFTICQFGLDIKTNDWYCGDTALYDVGRKRIMVNKITYPVASLRRLIKYTKQGYYACAGCLTTFLQTVQDARERVDTGTIRYLD